MNIPSYKTIRNISSALACAVLFSACATSGGPTAQSKQPAAPIQNTPEYVQAADLYYTVERGDLLTGIAMEFTGDADNWKTIADANGVTDPRKLRVGQQLIVPGHLLPLVENTVHTMVLPTSVAVQRPVAPAQRNNIDDIGPDAAKVQIVKANPNKRFVLRPLGTDVSGDLSAQPAVTDHIKVIGSYFPKVVYRAPELNAKQLMRVAPGTTFKLEKLADGWYQISTEQGSGYLRLQDGKLTNVTG